MSGKKGNNLINAIVSGRNAVIVITILTVASAAGWIFSEVIPRDAGFNEEA
jgi:hypothetical protein